MRALKPDQKHHLPGQQVQKQGQVLLHLLQTDSSELFVTVAAIFNPFGF